MLTDVENEETRNAEYAGGKIWNDECGKYVIGQFKRPRDHAYSTNYQATTPVLSQSTVENQQEAQLPLRNTASAMHFFVAKFVSYFYHRNDLLLRLSPPKRTSGKFVTHTANKFQHATAARAHDARPHCRLMSPS